MFKILHKALRRDDEPTPAITGHYVSDLGQITSLLVQAYKSHVLLNASFPDISGHFSTALLGIYDEHGFIVLDELTPRKGHNLFLQQGTINISGRLEGVEVRFSSRLKEDREKNGIAYYKAEIPREIYYRQRRQDFRITSRGERISFHGLRGKGRRQMIRGYINDLSRKGLGVVLEDDVTLYPGEVLPSCIIDIPGEGEIAFSLEVRFCSRKNRAQLTRIGGRFSQIDPDAQRKVARCINRMERVRARRIHGV